MKRVAFALSVLGTPVFADPEGYGRMMDGGYGHGYGMMFAPVLWLIVLGLVVAGVIWLVRRFDADAPRKSSSNALAELDMRLARGEIDIEEYSARKKALTA